MKSLLKPTIGKTIAFLVILAVFFVIGNIVRQIPCATSCDIGAISILSYILIPGNLLMLLSDFLSWEMSLVLFVMSIIVNLLWVYFLICLIFWLGFKFKKWQKRKTWLWIGFIFIITILYLIYKLL